MRAELTHERIARGRGTVERSPDEAERIRRFRGERADLGLIGFGISRLVSQRGERCPDAFGFLQQIKER